MDVLEISEPERAMGIHRHAEKKENASSPVELRIYLAPNVIVGNVIKAEFSARSR